MTLLPERSLDTIDPAGIEVGPGAPLRFRYALPGEPDACIADRDLEDSVARYGVMHPPLVLDGPSGAGEAPAVLQGHRRIAAACAAGLERIEILRIDGGAITPLEALSLCLEEIPYGESLSELERILLVGKAAAFAGEAAETLLGALSSVFGRELSGEFVQRLTRIIELGEPVTGSLHRGDVSPGDLLMLMEHHAVDAVRAVSMITSGKLSRSERREAVRLMLFLGDQGKERWEKFTGRHMDATALLERLRTACFPMMSRDRRDIEETISAMHLPPGTRIHHPENLEGGSYTVTIRLRNEELLSAALGKLSGALENGGITHLAGILRGYKRRGAKG